MSSRIKRKNTNIIPLLLTAIFLILASILLVNSKLFNRSGAAVPLNGSLSINGNQKLLKVWGSNYEMGYAHGYLMSDDIMSLLNNFLLDYLMDNNSTSWQNATNIVNTNMDFGEYSDELKGMYDGMKAKGGNIRLNALGRDLVLSDLKVWNAGTEIGVAKTACSSFAVWGNSSSTPLHARNLDFAYDRKNGTAVKTQILIAYMPQNKNKFLSVVWPGMIGALTAMNEQGLAITANISNGNGVNDLTKTNLVPIPLALRRLMETKGTAGNLLSDAWNKFVTMPRSRSFNSQWTQPNARVVADTSWVVESDATGQVVRKAASNQNFVYVTNHFLSKKAASSPTQSSLSRYSRIGQALTYLTSTGDSKVDPAESLEILKNVSESTIESVIFSPANLAVDVYFGALSGSNPTTLRDAPFTTPVRYTFASVFTGTPLPSFVPTSTPVSTSTATPTISPTPTQKPTVGHKITIVNKHNSSIANTIGIDAFVTDGTLVQESSPMLSYSGNWNFGNTSLNGSTRRVAYTNQDGASVSFSTTAKNVSLVTGGGSVTSTIKIYIDDVLSKVVDTNSSVNKEVRINIYP